MAAEAQNFDQVYPVNRSFIIGEQTFHWQPMWWRDFGDMVDEAVALSLKETRAAEEAEKRGEEPEESTLADTYERMIDGIVRYLEPSEVESFKAIVNDKAKRISHLQLSELRDWLREVTNNRPTEQLSPSAPGAGSDEATLRVV